MITVEMELPDEMKTYATRMKIGRLDLLKQYFGEVQIPEAVFQEYSGLE